MAAPHPEPPGPASEQYPGETLILLRAIHTDLAYLKHRLAEFEPLLAQLRLSGFFRGRGRGRGGDPR